jgi:hypothetical protein
MASTRFNYDKSRTVKQLQQSTDVGRWILNVPGNGTTPSFVEDPTIRIQKWGANVCNNHIDIESTLLGITVNHNFDCLDKSAYKKNVPGEETFTPQHYPTNTTLYVDQTRATHPSWQLRDIEQSQWNTPLLNTELNPYISHHYPINTRYVEKDTFLKNKNNR